MTNSETTKQTLGESFVKFGPDRDRIIEAIRRKVGHKAVNDILVKEQQVFHFLNQIERK
jgi:hypothetical protein